MTADADPSDGMRASGAGQRALVTEVLTNGLFRLRMTDGRDVVAHVAKDLRMAFSRLLPGDSVAVEVSPFDPGKARICRLLPKKSKSQHESPPNSQP